MGKPRWESRALAATSIVKRTYCGLIRPAGLAASIDVTSVRRMGWCITVIHTGFTERDQRRSRVRRRSGRPWPPDSCGGGRYNERLRRRWSGRRGRCSVGPLAAVMRNAQELKTIFTPIASAFGTALSPPGLTRYWMLGCTSRPGLTVHPYVHSKVISQLCTPTAGSVNT